MEDAVASMAEEISRLRELSLPGYPMASQIKPMNQNGEDTDEVNDADQTVVWLPDHQEPPDTAQIVHWPLPQNTPCPTFPVPTVRARRGTRVVANTQVGANSNGTFTNQPAITASKRGRDKAKRRK